MPINAPYEGPQDLPQTIPVFPLSSALLLPRADMPLNLFEPRYLAMFDAALSSNRLIGMVQPRADADSEDKSPPLSEIGCVGRITAFQESGDGRYIITLTGISRFRVVEELNTNTAYRQCAIDASDFTQDFREPEGDCGVDRKRLLGTLRAYLHANNLDADWEDINRAPTEALVNLLAMMSPYGAREKQALLEADTVASRSEILIAITEMSLMKEDDAQGSTLQ